MTYFNQNTRFFGHNLRYVQNIGQLWV